MLLDKSHDVGGNNYLQGKRFVHNNIRDFFEKKLYKLHIQTVSYWHGKTKANVFRNKMRVFNSAFNKRVIMSYEVSFNFPPHFVFVQTRLLW